MTIKNNKGIKEDVKIAKELGYSCTVITMLMNEPDRIKRTRIMHDARLGNLSRNKHGL